ncbi:hypothetical protein CDAR_274011 [Caerostris darwini]|uniref:Uncharacterized protein n=1 Tax=Caerostris darwini TaxID=1538125 RepID=A0AAV4RF02_9ARAC|nr:hypothetical protein CDAR_274011 [Caerostris darwini]
MPSVIVLIFLFWDERSMKSGQSYLKRNIRVLTAESNGNFSRLVSSTDHHTLSLIDSPNFKKGKNTGAAVRFCISRATCHRARIREEHPTIISLCISVRQTRKQVKVIESRVEQWGFHNNELVPNC